MNDYSIEQIVMGVLVFILVSPFVALVALGIISNIGSSKGTHTGYVTAVQEQGIVWETKRAYIKTSLESTQEDIYCVQDEVVYAALMEKSVSGEKVTVQYSHPKIEWMWNCEHEADIIISVN